MGELPDDLVIEVDREICIGAGMCVTYAPGTFAQDDEAKSTVLSPPGDPLDQIKTAIDACPMGALSLIPAGRGD